MAHRHRCEVARQPSGPAQLQRVLQPRRRRAWCQPSARETRGFRAFSPVHGHRIDIPSYRRLKRKGPGHAGAFFVDLSRNGLRDLLTCIACSTAASAAIRTASADRYWH
ncbi:hypothetical protein EX530_17125 [Xanthomonas phaseoli]